MQPFQQRVVDEKKELDERLAKLNDFWNNPIFGTLPDAEKVRLEKQSLLMQSYSEILGERIAAFDDSSK
jgi:hypothetical protein